LSFPTEFLKVASEVYEAGGNISDLSDQTGLTDKQLRDKLYGLRKQHPEANIPNFRVPPDMRKASDIDLSMRLLKSELKSSAKERELKDIKQQLARQANLEEVLKEQISCWPELPFTLGRVHNCIGQREQKAVLFISDVQGGQLVLSDDVGGLESYNWDVMMQRKERLFQRVCSIIELHRKMYPVREMSIFFGGDMVEGQGIYGGQAHNLETMVKQVPDIAYEFATFCYNLVKELGLDKMNVYELKGNHGQPGGKRTGYLPSNFNYDWLTYSMMNLILRDQPKIETHLSNTFYAAFKVFDWFFFGIHGDELKSYYGLPYYAVDRTHKRWENMLGRVIHFFLIAHHHQCALLPSANGGKKIMNGAWVGANNLTKNIQQASLPAQQLLFVHPEEGITAPYEIRLGPMVSPDVCILSEEVAK